MKQWLHAFTVGGLDLPTIADTLRDTITPMVTDRLANARLYRALDPRIAQAFDYIEKTDFATLADGKYPIDGDDVFALVQRYMTKPPEQGRWEAHRRYIDLQVVIDGSERIGYVDIRQLTQEPYDPERDLTWLSGHGEFVTVGAGSFMLLWPDDAHMPQIAAGAPAPVTKVVIKIKVDDDH